MTSEGIPQPAGPQCPRCGGVEVRPVEQAQSGKGAMTKNLGTRLQKGPDRTGDGCLHFVEGLVLSLTFGGGLAYMGVEKENSLYTAGGAVLALLILAVTIAVVRDDNREKNSERSGELLADEFWKPAHYCYGCEGVFCPGGTPWRGVLTPEQFKKLVWCEGRYDRQLEQHDKARNAEIPPGTLVREDTL